MLTTCFGRAAVPLLRVSACSPGSVCGLAPALWRIGHTPVAQRMSSARPQVSVSWFFRLKWTDVRASCWTKQVPGHARVTVLAHHGCSERPAGGFRSLLTPRAGRGLSSGKPEEAADRDERGLVPGQGLFKFKELVSPKPEHQTFTSRTPNCCHF